MVLTAGTRLGPYEIIAPIAAGGMGEVYKARDSRLQRDVAVKVLPELFAINPDRRARFEREAQSVAALSHPNILAIFDVGMQGSTAYAVTELLEGDTLRERLRSGPLPLRKAVDYSVQIARGLAAAHEKGIVHRDLKPENLFLLADGRLKILDFGIARSVLTEGTTTAGATDPGAVIGTVGYMAPEQVRGQTVDPRTDLFAFGAVLYEMLSGRRAFQGESDAETMTAILREDPPEITDVRTPLPPGLERIVRHCLEKNPAERFQSARDVAFAIDALSGTATGKAEAGAAQSGAKPRWFWPAAAILALMAAPAGFIAGRRASGSPPVVTFETKTFDQQVISNARFMPDGQTLVFSAGNTSIPDLYVSRAHTAAPQPLGPARTHLLSISSTGELAVLTGVTFLGHRLYSGTLARMTLDGAPRPWMDHVREADWAPNASDMAIVRDADRVDALEFPVGHSLHHTNGYVSDPRVSPDGQRVAFFDHESRFDDRGWVKIVDRGGAVTTLGGEFWALQGLVWTPDGRSLVFSGVLGGGLQGYQPYIVAAESGARPRQLLPTVGSVIVLDAAKDGRYLIMRIDDRLSTHTWTPATKAEHDVSWLNNAMNPTLSQDEKLVLFTDQSDSAGSNYATAYRTVDGGPVARLGEGTSVAISPDGKWALAWVIGDPPRLMVYPLGPGNPKQLDRGAITRYTSDARWFQDGRRVIACGSEGSQAPRCYQQTLDGKPEPVTPPGYAFGSIAPDGQALLLQGLDNSWHQTRLGDAAIKPFSALTPDDVLVGWTRDARGVYVQQAFSAKLERVDVSSGARTAIRDFNAGGAAATLAVAVGDYRDDGAYVYWRWQRPSTLFVAAGIAAR